MKYIDIENWPRKKHYQLFTQMECPHCGLCTNLDITNLYTFAKGNGFSIFRCILYAVAKTVNEIKEFKYRIRGNQVIEHDVIHICSTVMTKEELFSFCDIEYVEDFAEFYKMAESQIEKATAEPNLDAVGRDDQIYFSSIPWVSFTSLTHPMHYHPVDSVPRISIGKFFEENGRKKVPVSVQAHHALLDGLHLGKFYMRLQEIFYNPEYVYLKDI